MCEKTLGKTVDVAHLMFAEEAAHCLWQKGSPVQSRHKSSHGDEKESKKQDGSTGCHN